MRVAHVIVDIPSRAIETPFDYSIPDGLDEVDVGSCVLVEFGHRQAVGYVVGVGGKSAYKGRLQPVLALLAREHFRPQGARVAQWLAREYVAPLSEAVRLFTPPGGTPRAVRRVAESGETVWELRSAAVGQVDDRWVSLSLSSPAFVPRPRATLQRAVLDALAAGPVRVAELVADLGSVDRTISALERAGAVVVERRRRVRGSVSGPGVRSRALELTSDQRFALDEIEECCGAGGGVVVLDGVTGSGKTEVYLQAIDSVLAAGRSACVLVPEISLTPQTVGRFRARFGDAVAVLHSRLSVGERFDQWQLVRSGDARVVVGARSALFAPMRDVGLVVIDEEHEPSYKQGSSPRYHARAVAENLCAEYGATLVLGSATPSLETLERCQSGKWRHVRLPQRATSNPLPEVMVVDLAAEFSAGNRSMFSRALTGELLHVRAEGQKAVLFLNRRGFASFLLCRECGFVPRCDSCTTSMTYHEVGARLACHHCSATRPVPATCPACGSPYLRQFGAGTQRVESELAAHFPGWPVVRMDADTTRGKGGHERQLAAFEALDSGVLLGTQMIAKGLDYPDVTLVGVLSADITLNIPDFRSAERTYQLLEQVAGRAGRGSEPGRVVIQTYWPSHAVLQAVASHDPSVIHDAELAARAGLGYPPFGRLANVLVRGRDERAVRTHAARVADELRVHAANGVRVLGPSPAPLARVKGVWRWHVLVRAPVDHDVSALVAQALRRVERVQAVTVSADIDPLDLM